MYICFDNILLTSYLHLPLTGMAKGYRLDKEVTSCEGLDALPLSL